MKSAVCLKEYLDYLAGCGLKPATVKRMNHSLRFFLAYLEDKDIREVTSSDIAGYMEHLNTVESRYGKPLSPASVESYIGTVKSFFDFLCRNEYILTDPMENIRFRKRGKTGGIRMFSRKEIGEFLDSIPIDKPEHQRDRALYELMYSSGLRANEAFFIELSGVNFEERTLIIKQGKGGKDRYVPFSETALAFLVKYVNDGRKVHQKKIKNEENKRWLFLSVRGKITYGMMVKHFRKYLVGCGMSGKGLKMHSIRHSTATHLLEAGASIRYVQELLGHENIETTQIYARPTDENIRKIYKTYHPRENEYFEEITAEYLSNLRDLKENLTRCRAEKRRKKQLKST